MSMCIVPICSRPAEVWPNGRVGLTCPGHGGMCFICGDASGQRHDHHDAQDEALVNIRLAICDARKRK